MASVPDMSPTPDPFAHRPRVALVTGSAGFIGYHLCARLLDEGWQVIGVDALSDYYDVALKERRHAMLNQKPGFTAHVGRIEAPGLLQSLFSDHQPALVVHLAAQAGVRYSIDNPRSYVEANLLGTFELLEAARAHPPVHMLLASTSSAYGANADMPYRETHKADAQVSFYAATKKATEAMAHSYSHLYDLPCTMFRFFTVYGPWGRPDMALFKFTKAVLEGRPIDVYNHGDMQRDFTYVDDLVEGIRLLADALPPHPSRRWGPELRGLVSGLLPDLEPLFPNRPECRPGVNQSAAHWPDFAPPLTLTKCADLDYTSEREGTLRGYSSTSRAGWCGAGPASD